MKTTPKQFETFKKECEKWIAFWGLKNWQINYQIGNIGDFAAKTVCNFDQHQVTIALSDTYKLNWAWKLKDLKRYAFHEVCHVLLERLDFLAGHRCIQISEIDEEVHNIIRTLENVVFK